MSEGSLRVWVEYRELELGRKISCCTIGAIKFLQHVRCSIHEPAPKPTPWVPEWDAYDFA